MSGVTSSTHVQSVLRESERESTRNDAEALAWVLSDPRGRRFMSRLLRVVCGIDEPTTGQGLALMQLYEGRRHVAVDLRREIRAAAPDALALMAAEEAEREKSKRKTKQVAEAIKGDDE